MRPAINFVLYEVLPESRVIGRNCGNADLALGTGFTALYRSDYSQTEPGGSPEAMFVCGLSLRIDAIEMFLRSFDSVGPSCSALLSLSGSGLDTVADLLSVAPERTYYSLS